MYTSAVKKAIAGSKLSFIEKYGFAYEEDIALIKEMLDAKVTYSSDGTKVRIEVGDRIIDATIRTPEQKKYTGSGEWIES